LISKKGQDFIFFIVLTGSEFHQCTYPTGTKVSFLGIKWPVRDTYQQPLTIQFQG